MLQLMPLVEAADTFTVSEGVRLVLTSVFSAPLLLGAGAGMFKLRQSRKERRLAERKDTHTEENDLVAHWKQAAENAQKQVSDAQKSGQELVVAERASKDSAIQAVKQLLDIQEAQNAGLRDTIQRLSDAIERLTTAGGAASQLVADLRAERDLLQRQLEHAMQEVARLTQELARRQRDLLGPEDASTAELAALDAHLQRKVDTGEIPLPPMEGAKA